MRWEKSGKKKRIIPSSLTNFKINFGKNSRWQIKRSEWMAPSRVIRWKARVEARRGWDFSSVIYPPLLKRYRTNPSVSLLKRWVFFLYFFRASLEKEFALSLKKRKCVIVRASGWACLSVKIFLAVMKICPTSLSCALYVGHQNNLIFIKKKKKNFFWKTAAHFICWASTIIQSAAKESFFASIQSCARNKSSRIDLNIPVIKLNTRSFM